MAGMRESEQSDKGLAARHRPSGLNSRFEGEGLAFADYVARTKAMLREAHERLGRPDRERVVEGCAPFELFPADAHAGSAAGPESGARGKPYRRGVLLVHGLSDSPYSMRALGEFFARNGFRAMAILLPGHGTQPGDLLHMRWQEWAKAVAYGAGQLAQEVDELYLAGYSTGAALSLRHAQLDKRVRGLFLFSPALEISPRARWANLHRLYSWLLPKFAWFTLMPDEDCYKYESFCRNSAAQMHALTRALSRSREAGGCAIPVFAAASADDATVHPEAVWRFMRDAAHVHKQLVWYAKDAPQELPGHVEWVRSALPERRILDSAHTSVVIPPSDAHYGERGDYVNCLHYWQQDRERHAQCRAGSPDAWYGEVSQRNLAHGLLRRLMYNPHHAELEASMRRFIDRLEA